MQTCLRVSLIIIILISAACIQERKSKEQLFADGVAFLQSEKPGEAYAVFKKILDKDPNYFEARLQLAKTYAMLGNTAAAEKELEKVRRQNPSSRDVKIETARIMVANRHPGDALKEIAPYLGDGTSDCDALQVAGSAYALQEDYGVSIALVTKAVSACGSANTRPTLQLAGVYSVSGKQGEAERLITGVTEREPGNREALYMLAEIQLARKDKAAALKVFDRILQIRPGDVEAQYRKGLLYLETADYDKAIAIGQELTKTIPNAPQSQRLLGYAFFLKKQYGDALAPLQKSLALQPNAGTYYVLGVTHAARNEFEQAMNQFQKALDLQPSLTAARLQLAQVLLQTKRVEEAVREAKKTLAEGHDNAYAHNILGSAYLSRGEYAEGMAELNKALSLDPSLADIHWKKGLVALKRGMGQEAEAELRTVVNLKPDAENARRLLAAQYINRNEFAKAIETLQKGRPGGAPLDAVSCYLMGESLLRQNREDEAKAYYTRAKEADPRYDLAYLRLSAIYFKQDKTEQGVQELKDLLAHSPDNIQALLLLAALDEINGNAGNAREGFIRAAGTGKTEGVVAAAYYLARTNDRPGALKIVDDAINRAGAQAAPAFYELKGKILLGDKKYRDALAAFEALEHREPSLAFGYIINTYIAMGQPAKAIEKVQAEIRKNPTAPGLRAELSRVQVQAGDRQAAAETAREIIRRMPGSTAGYLALALVHQQGRDYDEAIKVLKGAPKTEDVQVPLFLSNLYALQKKYAPALEECTRAQKAKRGGDLVLFQKAAILDAMGRRKEAETEYLKLLRIVPNHGIALNNLAYIYLQENRNLQQALLYATRALILLPGNDTVRDTLGYALVKTGRTAQGLKMLEKVSESDPKNATIRYHIAVAYSENGEPAKAVETLQQALALGEFPEAQSAAALLNKLRKAKTS